MNPPAPDALLQRHGVKPTPQRVVILEYLVSTPSHPTADEVLEAVQNKLPVALSRATVYNTLNTLVDAGVIRAISTEPGRTRYDANPHEHHHFVDTETGRIFDIPWEQVNQLCESLGQDYQIQDYQITFFGKYQGKPS